MATGAANTSTPALVGWTAGPETRGTLTLVWSCVITIFACTWTVLHLNVPARDEHWFPVLLRKVKWMAINILFPEFIFAKGVCDLRLALEELREFDESERARKIEDKHLLRKWTAVSESLRFESEWCWEFAYPPWAQWLYRLLGLKPPTQTSDQKPFPRWSSTFGSFFTSKAELSERRTDIEAQEPSHADDHERAELSEKRTDIEAQEPSHADDHERATETPPSNPKEVTNVQEDRHGNSSRASSIASSTARRELSRSELSEEAMQHGDPNVQKWTVVHSYYAQMGGIQYRLPRMQGTDWYCLTASMLTTRYVFLSADKARLFDHLVLGEQDIKDKSKADWVLKGIAIAQVSWLILSVIVRSILHLPITQLEIATISFAAMAILSYSVNWWKPKDISRATVLSLPAWGITESSEVYARSGIGQTAAYAQSLISRLRSPKKTWKEAKDLNDYLLRVPNDLVWMKGEIPLLFILMAFSSLGFGGLHCLAWNFEFPSTAELLCWRVASIVSTALPTIILGIDFVFRFLPIGYIKYRRASMLLNKLKPIDKLGPDIWEYIENPHWKQWGFDAKLFLARNPTGVRNWDEEPSAEIIEKYRDFEPKQLYPWNFPTGLVGFIKTWQKARETTPYAARTVHDEWFGYGTWMQSISEEEVDFWKDYENYVKRKHHICDPETADHDWITLILRAYNETTEETLWWTEALVLLDKASLPLIIINVVIYTVARLTILVLLFTCLRETPVDVYRVTPWVNFLPNIS